jgi:hypothetical protein
LPHGCCCDVVVAGGAARTVVVALRVVVGTRVVVAAGFDAVVGRDELHAAVTSTITTRVRPRHDEPQARRVAEWLRRDLVLAVSRRHGRPRHHLFIASWAPAQLSSVSHA